MANNAISNGRIHQTSVTHRLRGEAVKKVTEVEAIETRNWLLHRYYTRHQYKICKILIAEELNKSNGYNEYAHYLMGLILRREGRVQDSLDCFQMSYNVNPNNVNNVKQIAKSLLILGSHKRAAEAYLEAEKISPVPDWEIHYWLGVCYIKLNRADAALRHLSRSVELTKNELPYLELGGLHRADGKVAEARSVYTTALNGNPESVEVATELGLLELEVGDVRKAFQQFGAALALLPNCVQALLPLAYIIQKHGEHDVALSKYKLAAQSISESSALWNNVGMCFYGKQKYVAAISCLKRAHYLNPMAALPACNLGLVFMTTGQPASAAIYLCAAVTSDPTNPRPFLLLGLALTRLNDLEGAVNALAKAHGLSPQDPLILINYATVLESLGRREDALEMLTSLNDIAALIDVDLQIVQAAKRLSAKMQASHADANDEERVLDVDEV